MAAFSTLAMIGLAAAGGAALGKKLGSKGSQQQQPVNAPGPTTTTSSTVPEVPPAPDTTKLRSEAGAKADQAAQRQKRRARGGMTTLPIGAGSTLAGAVTTPKTLIGY
jgi:hypothetical protein